MKRIDESTVELTERELFLSARFEEALDEGLSIADAVRRVKATTDVVESIGGMGKTDPKFWEYLLEPKSVLRDEDDNCRPTCAARRDPNAECVCAELDELGR